MHYASYGGNPDIINILLLNGADKTYLSYSGLNLIHLAAQGDSAYSITLFKEQGLDLNAGDSSHITPLHWACIKASYSAF